MPFEDGLSALIPLRISTVTIREVITLLERDGLREEGRRIPPPRSHSAHVEIRA